jgi:hypothetical protein
MTNQKKTDLAAFLGTLKPSIVEAGLDEKGPLPYFVSKQSGVFHIGLCSSSYLDFYSGGILIGDDHRQGRKPQSP